MRSFHFVTLAILLSSAGWLPAGPDVVFVSRAIKPVPPGAPQQPAGTVERAAWGQLRLLRGGQPQTLVDGKNGASEVLDAMDPDLSYEGTSIVFSGFSRQDQAFRIYEVKVDGSDLRKLTQSDPQVGLERHGPEAQRALTGYDDLDPCYLPDGRICFVSTRYPEIAPDGRSRSTNLYVMNADGSDLHRITTERFGADTPAVDPSSGRIVYSRWWRTAQTVNPNTGKEPEPIPPGSPGYGGGGPATPPAPDGPGNTVDDGVGKTDPRAVSGISDADFPGVNSWFLAGINPDGTGLAMYSGFRLDREQTQAYRPSFFPDGRAVALFIPRTPHLGTPGNNGLRQFPAGAGRPEPLGGPQTFGQDRNFPAIDGTPFVYASVAALPDGRLLVSAKKSDFAPDYDIYIKEGAKAPPVPVFMNPEAADLDAVPLIPRSRPLPIPDAASERLSDQIPQNLGEAEEQGGTFTFRVENIHFNAPVDFPIASAPPVGRRLSIEFYTSPQRTGLNTADPPILIKQVEIGADGSVEVELPGGVPLFELLRRPDGTIAVGRDGQIFHVGGMNFGQAGQKARCVGCHAGHTLIEVPEDASFTNLAGSALVASTNFIDRSGKPLEPERFIDRSTGRQAARFSPPPGPLPQDSLLRLPNVQLGWSVPLRAREVVLHGRPGSNPRGGGAEGLTWTFTVSTRLGKTIQEQAFSNQEFPAAGMRFSMNPAKIFDSLTVTMSAVRISDGRVVEQYQGLEVPGLAEVEVIAQQAGPSAITLNYVRGDANCDTHVNVSDAVAILNSLFLGKGPLCCETGSDSNSDAAVNVSDAIHLLDFSFQGGAPPAAPYPECAGGPEAGMTCEIECR